MGRAPWSIAEAIRTTLVAEDRTTGAFAAAVVVHREFASAVFNEIDPKVVCIETIEARLQVHTSEGRFVDLELVAWTPLGVTRLWIEAKWDAAWQIRQLAHYGEELGERGTLVGLVPASRQADVERHGARPLTWERVTVLADRAGAQIGGRRWRKAASEPNVPAQQRVLDLFLHHLREEHGLTTESLRTEHSLALRLNGEAIAITDRLADEAFARAGYVARPTGEWPKSRGKGWRLDIEGLKPWHPEGFFRFVRSPQDQHREDPTGDPVFYAGLTVLGHVGERLIEDEDLNDWRAALAKDGVAISTADSKETNLFCARSVAQVAAEASSFDGQAEHLTEWMVKALQAATRPPPASWAGEGPSLDVARAQEDRHEPDHRQPDGR